MSGVRADTQTVSREYWRRFLQRTVAPESKRDIQRGEPRYPLPGDIKLLFDDKEETSVRNLSLINASQDGLTVKGQTKIQVDTNVRIELNPEGTPFSVRGRIVHCTETLGGFKIGIELKFS